MTLNIWMCTWRISVGLEITGTTVYQLQYLPLLYGELGYPSWPSRQFIGFTTIIKSYTSHDIRKYTVFFSSDMSQGNTGGN